MSGHWFEALFPLALDLALKGIVAFTLVLPLLALLRSHSAALRHGLLTGIFVLLLLTPAMAPVLPALEVPVLPASWFGAVETAPTGSVEVFMGSMEYTAIVPGEVEPASAFTWPDYREIVLGLWLAGAAAVAVWLVVGQVQVRRLVQRSMAVGRCSLRDRAAEIAREQGAGLRWRLLLSDETPVPLVIGVRRPAVVLPADAAGWHEQRLEMALRHEMAHVARRDMFWQIPALLGTVLFWFNPLAWRAAQRQMREREQACDDDVLRAGFRPSEYAAYLLETARSLSRGSMLRWAAIGMARGAEFKVRMNAILSSRQDRSPLTPGRALAVVILCCLVVLPVAAWRAWSDSSPSPDSGELFNQVVPEETGNSGSVLTSDKLAPIEITPPANSPFIQETVHARETEQERVPILEVGKDGIAEPILIHRVEPEMPPAAKVDKAEGFVVLSALIGPDGGIESVQVLEESNPGFGFGEASITAITQWRFEPTLINGKPVRVRVKFSTEFSHSNRHDSSAERGMSPVDQDRPIEVSGDVVKPKVSFSAPQHFPEKAKAERVSGSARIRLIIHADGRPEIDSVISENPPDYGFAEAAKEYLLAAEWTPARKGDKPVTVYFEITIVYALTDSSPAGKPVEMGPGITPPSVQFMNAQPMPQKARILKRSGLVKLRLIVRKNGAWELDHLISEAPAEFGFADAAVEYLQSSIWKPATRNGVPLDVYFELTMMFNNPEKPAGTRDIPFGDVLLTAGTGGDVPMPEVVNRVEPVYPERAKRERIEGAVQVVLVLELDGTVREASMTKEEPGGYGFADAALAAVKQWRFAKTVVKGRPVRVKTALTVKFDLKEKVGVFPVAEQAWDTPPLFDHYTRLVVPAAAKASRFGGSVTLRLRISETGEVISSEILDQKPSNRAMAEAYRQSMATSIWRPALKDGKPITVTFDHVLHYSPYREPQKRLLPFAEDARLTRSEPHEFDPDPPQF